MVQYMYNIKVNGKGVSVLSDDQSRDYYILRIPATSTTSGGAMNVSMGWRIDKSLKHTSKAHEYYPVPLIDGSKHHTVI